ncbi:hypothetical protein EG328_002596 [Venturia inaequalis]|uniref:Uncharacterized protein n=1 Tax=Venturia inaequalis TaxID=5025 RepID=A0A8H3YWF1_VENIN|nr:hypothetical protein EG328_002596 [Venturia inaequalis]
MNFTPYQHFSYNESLPQRISQSEGLSHVNDTEPQSWLRAPQALPDNLIDPNLVASSFPPASNTYEFFSDQEEGHVAEGKIYHHGDQEQDTDYFVNDPSQQQPYQPIIGEEMDGQIYHGAPSPYYMAPTANGVERFRWNPNGSPASHQVEAFPLRGLKDIDSVGLGALFPQDDQVLQQSVDDADLGNLGHGPPGLYHTQSSPQLSFRKDEDYSFTTSYNNDGTRGMNALTNLASKRCGNTGAMFASIRSNTPKISVAMRGSMMRSLSKASSAHSVRVVTTLRALGEKIICKDTFANVTSSVSPIGAITW